LSQLPRPRIEINLRQQAAPPPLMKPSFERARHTGREKPRIDPRFESTRLESLRKNNGRSDVLKGHGISRAASAA
jgi:hypothetical protein